MSNVVDSVEDFMAKFSNLRAVAGQYSSKEKEDVEQFIDVARHGYRVLVNQMRQGNLTRDQQEVLESLFKVGAWEVLQVGVSQLPKENAVLCSLVK